MSYLFPPRQVLENELLPREEANSTREVLRANSFFTGAPSAGYPTFEQLNQCALIVKVKMENEFDSDDTEPFPFDGQPLVTTPSPAATSKEEDELQSAEEKLSKFSRRSSPSLFEFSDDESQTLLQVNNLIKLSEQTSRFEEASRKLTKAMTENTACMNRLLDREEASISRETNNGKPEQKRSTPGRCVDCGKIRKRREPQ